MTNFSHTNSTQIIKFDDHPFGAGSTLRLYCQVAEKVQSYEVVLQYSTFYEYLRLESIPDVCVVRIKLNSHD